MYISADSSLYSETSNIVNNHTPIKTQLQQFITGWTWSQLPSLEAIGSMLKAPARPPLFRAPHDFILYMESQSITCSALSGVSLSDRYPAASQIHGPGPSRGQGG